MEKYIKFMYKEILHLMMESFILEGKKLIIFILHKLDNNKFIYFVSFINKKIYIMISVSSLQKEIQALESEKQKLQALIMITKSYNNASQNSIKNLNESIAILKSQCQDKRKKLFNQLEELGTFNFTAR